MKFLLAFAILLSTLAIQAQDTNYVDPNYKSEKSRSPKKSKTPLSNRTYFGGTFGVQFGSFTSILVEPLIGFKMTEKLSVGLGIGLRYGKDNVNDFEYTNYLGRFFARYLVTEKIYGHIEYMGESYDSSFGKIYRDFNPNGRSFVPFLFVGGGYRSVAGRGAFIFQVLFNVLQNSTLSKTIYPSNVPYISIGYIGGF